MQTGTRQSKKTKTTAALIGVVGLLLTLFSWGLASPVGASPDEDFHLISIWCANGGQDSVCEEAAANTQRMVNKGLILAACYARDANLSAACQTEATLFEDQSLHLTSRGNFEGTYPEFFYSTMGLFATPNIQGSVIAMRFFNATVFALILALLWVLLPRFMRSSLYFTATLTIVPLGLFLIPSVNPSSWAIMGTIAAFFGLAGAMQSSGNRSWQLAGIAAFGVLLAGGARYDGLLYALVAVSAAFLIAKKFQITRKMYWYFAGTSLAAITLFLIVGGVEIASRLISFAGGIDSSAGRSPMGVFANNIAHFTELWAGFSGATGLGWLDTPIPRTAWMTLAVLVWGTLFLMLGRVNKTQLWVGATLLFLLALIPLATLQIGNSVVGENVQSRYIFPLFIVLVATMLFRFQAETAFFSQPQLIVIVLGVFFGQTLSIYTNMTRYITGLDSGFSLNLNQAAANGWWWPAGPSPMMVLFISVLGFATFLSTAFWVNKSDAEELGEFKMKQVTQI